MWIEELPSGKFKFIERYKDAKTGRFKRVSVTLDRNTSQSRKHAQSVLNERIEGKLKATTANLSDMTFEEAYKAMMAVNQTTWAVSTYANYRSRYNCHIKPKAFNEYIVTKITHKDVQDLIIGLEYELASKVIAVIKATFSHLAVNYGYQSPVVFEKIKKKKPTLAPTKSRKIMDAKEASAFIEKARSQLQSLYVNLFELLIHTGLRGGELIALEIKDYDPVAQTLTINKSYSPKAKTIIPPKTAKGYRTIDLNKRSIEIIEEQILYNRILFGEKAWLIFSNSKNKYMNQQWILSKLKMVDSELTVHSLRHTHITLLVENGADLKYIQQRVGHASIATTMDIYTHLTAEAHKRNKDILDNL